MPQLAFTTLMPEIQPWCPGVASPLVKDAVRRAVRYFCQETDLLQITSDPLLDVTANEPYYTIDDPLGSEIVRVLEVFVEGKQLAHRSEQQIDRDFKETVRIYGRSNDAPIVTLSDPWRTESSWPVAYWYQERPRTIRLVPIPSQASVAGMEITVSIKPNLSSTAIESFILENWYEAITVGAVAHLLGIPKKSWTDKREAQNQQTIFENMVSGINDEAASGFYHNSQSVGHVKAYP